MKNISNAQGNAVTKTENAVNILVLPETRIGRNLLIRVVSVVLSFIMANNVNAYSLHKNIPCTNVQGIFLSFMLFFFHTAAFFVLFTAAA